MHRIVCKKVGQYAAVGSRQHTELIVFLQPLRCSGMAEDNATKFPPIPAPGSVQIWTLDMLNAHIDHPDSFHFTVF